MTLTALLFTDVLWLRAFMILAGACSIYVNLFVIKPRFWPNLLWSLIFILLNVLQIIRILADRAKYLLTPEEEKVYQEVFEKSFARFEFRKIVSLAHYKEFLPGEVLVSEGDEIDGLMLIVDGLCDVERGLTNRRHISYLKTGQLLGELEFFRDHKSKAPASGNLELINKLTFFFFFCFNSHCIGDYKMFGLEQK